MKLDKEEEEKIKQIEIAKKTELGLLSKFKYKIVLLFSLLKSYWYKEYSDLTWSSISALVITLLYLVRPIEIIPDPVLGFLDDILVLYLFIKFIDKDLIKFETWQVSKKLLGT